MAASDLSSATAVPLTTTHRWIETLEQKGWLHRSPDPLDQRRVFVQLSERGTTAMQVWINDWMEGIQDQIDASVRDLLPRINRSRERS